MLACPVLLPVPDVSVVAPVGPVAHSVRRPSHAWLSARVPSHRRPGCQGERCQRSASCRVLCPPAIRVVQHSSKSTRSSSRRCFGRQQPSHSGVKKRWSGDGCGRRRLRMKGKSAPLFAFYAVQRSLRLAHASVAQVAAHGQAARRVPTS